MANIEDCLVQTVFPKIGSFPIFEVIHSEAPWYCAHAEKGKERFVEIINYPNEMEYLILWACLIWINHMKAIKQRLPFMGWWEEKMSI